MKLLQRLHWFFFLLPIFFVAHGVRENYGFIEIKDASILLLTYFLLAAILWLPSYALFRNTLSSSLMASAIVAYDLFFGALKDFIASIHVISFLSKYSFLLSLGFISLVYIGYRLYKKPASPSRGTRYLSTLLWILVIVEFAQIGYRSTQKSEGLSIYYSNENTVIHSHCTNFKKPNIYFLLFDEYENSRSLKTRFNFNNTLDSTLINEQFKVIDPARSNYNFTPFSMASILNMDYLEGIQDTSAVGVEDYAKCNERIKNNRLIAFLSSIGYAIKNYSIFDLAGHPSQVEQSLLPLKAKLIADRTLFAYVKKDIGWKLKEYAPFNYLLKQDQMRTHFNNVYFQKEVIEASCTKSSQPFFLYAHFYMPHPPFYRNAQGSLRAFSNEEHMTTPARYLDYVVYTNTQIMKMIRTIKEKDTSGIILIMGDHGYRNKIENAAYHFNALNAVYFPDQQYALFEPAHSHVNQFRLILNKLFCTNLPLLQDKQVYLKDKQPTQ